MSLAAYCSRSSLYPLSLDLFRQWFTIKQDPINVLPNELMLEIFSHLNLATLGKVCCASRSWKQLANESNLWKIAIYKELTLPANKWAKLLGGDLIRGKDLKDELISMPLKEFIEDCREFKKAFPRKNIKNNLLLVKVPTVENIYEFLNIMNGYDLSNYKYHRGEKCKFRWLLIIKDELLGRRDESQDEQQLIIDIFSKKYGKEFKNDDFLREAKVSINLYEWFVILEVSALICTKHEDAHVKGYL